MPQERHPGAVSWDNPFQPVCPSPTGLFHPVAIDPAGVVGPTRGQAARRGWRRVGPKRYVPTQVDAGLPEQRVLEAAVHLPGSGAVTGWGALRMAGAAYFDGRPRGRTRPVLLALGHGDGRATPAGCRLSYEPLEPDEVMVRHGVRVTKPVRALFDEMRQAAEVREAVVAMDMTAAAGLVSIGQLARYHRSRTRWRRSSIVGDALPYASERSRSPAETRLRLVYELDAKLPGPLVNRSVYDLRGRLICVADLFDDEVGMVVEYDGAEHRKAGRHARDVRREDLCRRAGLEYAKVTGPDMYDVDLVVDRLRSTRARALSRPAGARLWTLQGPPGERPEESIEEQAASRAWVLEQMAQERLWTPPSC